MDEQAKDMASQEVEPLASEAMESLGVPEEVANQSASLESKVDEDVPPSIQKRLGKQAERHRKEMRAMQEQLQALQERDQMAQRPNEQIPSDGQQQPNEITAHINQAVAAALRAKEDREHQKAQEAKAAESNEHARKQYQAMQDNFDKAGEKYDDFDDVVRHPEAPFTPAMRDYALTLDNAADVLLQAWQKP